MQYLLFLIVNEWRELRQTFNYARPFFFLLQRLCVTFVLRGESIRWLQACYFLRNCIPKRLTVEFC